MMIRLPSLFVLLIFCGCTYSVHRLLTEKELADDVDISGHWLLEASAPTEKEKQRLPLELDKYDNSTYDVYLDEDFLIKGMLSKTVHNSSWSGLSLSDTDPRPPREKDTT